MDAHSQAPAVVLHGPMPNPHNGHVYYLLSPSTWTISNQTAKSLGGYLVAINDDEECDWIYNTFSWFGGVPRALWCGLTDRDSEGLFQWTSGEPVLFTNWAAGEPNQNPLTAPDENFVFIFPSANPRDKRWRDANNLATAELISDARWATAEEVNFGCQGLVEIEPSNTHPILPTIAIEPDQTRLQWESRTGAAYQIQSANNLQGPWVNQGETRNGTGEILSVKLPPHSDQQGFFRIVFAR